MMNTNSLPSQRHPGFLASAEGSSTLTDVGIVTLVQFLKVRQKGAGLDDFVVPAGLENFAEQNLQKFKSLTLRSKQGTLSTNTFSLLVG